MWKRLCMMLLPCLLLGYACFALELATAANHETPAMNAVEKGKKKNKKKKTHSSKSKKHTKKQTSK